MTRQEKGKERQRNKEGDADSFKQGKRNPEEFVIAAQRALSVPVRAAFSGLRVEL